MPRTRRRANARALYCVVSGPAADAFSPPAERQHLDAELAPAPRAVARRIARGLASSALAVVAVVSGPAAPGASAGAATVTSQVSGELPDGHPQLGEQIKIILRRAPERRQIVTDDHRVDPAEHALARPELTQRQLAPAARTAAWSAASPDGTPRSFAARRRSRSSRAPRTAFPVADRGSSAAPRRRSSSASCAANSARCSSDSPIPMIPPQHTSIPCSRTSSSVCRRSSQRVRRHDLREERARRLQVVVVAVDAEITQLLALLAREDPRDEHATLISHLLVDRRRPPRRPAPSSARPGPRTAATMQNSLAPVDGGLPRRRTSDGMSSTNRPHRVSNRPDCEQK